MPLGYVVASINVTNPEAYPEYVKKVQPTIEAFGGQFLARGGRTESYENEPFGTRQVIIQFPSYQAAKDWYHSDQYAEAKAMRQAASTSVQTIVEGV